MQQARLNNVLQWLESHQKDENGFYLLSPDRRFQHNEDQYDSQYHGGESLNLSPGLGLANLIKSREIDNSSAAWELGCGTGNLTLGIAASQHFPLFIATDISSAFLQIVRRKADKASLLSDKFNIAVYDTDNYYSPPPGASFSVICMQNALHHVLEPGSFIKECSESLVPGGALIFDEPCREASILLATLAMIYEQNRFKTSFLGRLLSLKRPAYADEYIHNARVLKNAISYSIRCDVDKSKAEDKHVFMPEQVFAWAQAGGLEVEFIPHKYFTFYAGPGEPSINSFNSMRDISNFYFKFCLGFTDAFIHDFNSCLEPYFAFFDETFKGAVPPVAHGIFICRKK